MLYDSYKLTYSFKVNEKKIILAPLQHSEIYAPKKEVSAFMSYCEFKGELEKGGPVMALVVVEANEQHKETPGAILPNKVAYKMSPKEHEELQK